MPVASGRGSAGRDITVSTTSGSTALTAPAGTFDTARDLNRPITGPGIPAGATLTAVASATAATLSANATATGANVDATLGMLPGGSARVADELAYGFRGWSPETPAEAGTYQMGAPNGGPGVNEPSRVTSPSQGPAQRRYRRQK